MTACTAQPVSWLELERHALGELPPARAGRVAAHLQDCPVCRACAESIAADDRPLPRLVVPAAAPRRPWWRRAALSWSLAGVAAAAVILLLVLRRGDDRTEVPPGAGARVQVKGGGEVLVELVGERGGQVLHDPTRYRDGDRFQVLVTCGFAADVTAEVVVFQGGQAHRPGRPAPLVCGNRVVLPAAFRLTGREPVTVCVHFADGATSACIPLSGE